MNGLQGAPWVCPSSDTHWGWSSAMLAPPCCLFLLFWFISLDLHFDQSHLQPVFTWKSSVLVASACSVCDGKRRVDQSEQINAAVKWNLCSVASLGARGRFLGKVDHRLVRQPLRKHSCRQAITLCSQINRSKSLSVLIQRKLKCLANF